MNLWGPAFFDDEALIAEIKEYVAARKKVSQNNIAVIAGEGRRLEFTGNKSSKDVLDADLREMLAEARRRGLEIGGDAPSAIGVEFGIE